MTEQSYQHVKYGVLEGSFISSLLSEEVGLFYRRGCYYRTYSQGSCLSYFFELDVKHTRREEVWAFYGTMAIWGLLTSVCYICQITGTIIVCLPGPGQAIVNSTSEV